MSAIFAGPWPYVLVGTGVSLALLNAVTTYRRSVTTAKFLAFVRAKAEAGDHAQLRRAISNPPIAELMALTRRWLDLDLDPVVHAPAQGGYREPAEVVPLEARARAALEPYVEGRRAQLRARLPSSLVAACLAVAGFAIGAEREWVPTLAGLGGLLAAYGAQGVWRLRQDLRTTLDLLVTLPRPEPVDESDDAEAEPSPSGRPRRLVVRGPGGDRQSLPLEAGVVKIGTLDRADLRLEGEDVSRLHAVLEVGSEDVWLIDLGTAAGTWVNGERINKHALVVGDRVTIGDHELEVA